jgi:LacI family transcriptional regulator
MRPTVHDIAEKAGVSLATVDRVLNRRPGVRAKTRELVEEAISEIGYIRDVAAANLAKKRLYRFEFLIPDNDNSFMRLLRDVVGEVASTMRLDRVDVELREIPAYDPDALIAEIIASIARKADGIAIVAIDHDGVRAAADAADAAGIPVVTLVSDLPGSRRIHYAGIDNVAAGRTAAALLGRFMGAQKGDVAVIAGLLVARDHRERLSGFEDVIGESFSGFRVLPVIEGRDDPVLVEKLVSRLLADNPDIVGIYSLGGGNRGLLRALKASGRGVSLPVVAHELTSTAREALNSGHFDAVLNQDPGHEVRSAIRVMKAHADGQAVVEAQERIRIDIFLKDNLP